MLTPDEGLVLDDQGEVGHGRDAGGGSVGQRALGGVDQEVACGFTGVHVQAGDSIGVVMVEHEATTLLVGVVEGHFAFTGRHARDVLAAHAFIEEVR